MSTKKKRSAAPQQAELWFAEHGSKLLWAAGGGGAAVLAILYVLNLIEERVAGALLATLIIGVACTVGIGAMSEVAPNRGRSLLALLIGVTIFGAAMGAALPAVMPGEPSASGALRKEGDSLQLPASIRGSIRLLVHGKVAGSEAGTATVDLDVGHQHLTAEVNRSFSRARVGRGGSTTVVNEHDAEYLDAEAGPDAGRITLSGIHGPLGGPVEVTVFTDPLPLRWEIVLGLALFVFGSWISASWGARSGGMTALTCALLFGVLVRRMATPTAAVGPEFGALMISVFAAVFISTIVLTVMQRLVAGSRGASGAQP